MNIVITGATGFLGSQIVKRFASLDAVNQIIATGRTLKESNHVHSTKVKYLLGNLEDAAFTNSLFANKVDIVVNCASKSSPWGSKNEFYKANIITQQNLITASKSNHVSRFIYISSPSIYFDFEDQYGITEQTTLPYKMVNNYAASKVQAEKILENAQLNYVTLRPRALIGAGDTVIMPRLLRSHLAGRLSIMGSGTNIVDLTPVQNVVDAVWLAVNTHQKNCNTAYNISNGIGTALWPQINSMLTKLGYKPITKKHSYKLLYCVAWLMELHAKITQKEPTLTRYSVGILARNFTLDIAKATEKLSYVPKQTISEAIDEFVKWYKENNHD